MFSGIKSDCYTTDCKSIQNKNIHLCVYAECINAINLLKKFMSTMK